MKIIRNDNGRWEVGDQVDLPWASSGPKDQTVLIIFQCEEVAGRAVIGPHNGHVMARMFIKKEDLPVLHEIIGDAMAMLCDPEYEP